MTIPTDTELAQAYDQGWQDRGAMQAELVAALREAKVAIDLLNDLAQPEQYMPKLYERINAALAKVAQDAPATKGE